MTCLAHAGEPPFELKHIVKQYRISFLSEVRWCPQLMKLMVDMSAKKRDLTQSLRQTLQQVYI